MSKTDDALSEFADEVLWQQRRKVRSGRDINIRFAVAPSSSADRASAVRDHVRALLRNSTQVMVKITGGGADMKRIGSHMDYVSRGGKYRKRDVDELELENDAGQILLGKEGRAAVKREWQLGGSPIPEEIQVPPGSTFKPRREALNIIFSMPAFGGRDTIKHAIRATVNELFPNHQWVMAHHEDTPNQHAHLLIKMVDKSGNRMNPRKADLEQWRITFARELNKRGIEAQATRRRVRMHRPKGESQAKLEMRKRGVKPSHDSTAQTQPEAQQRALDNEAKMLAAYKGIAASLTKSDDSTDQALGDHLAKHIRRNRLVLPSQAEGNRGPSPA